MWKKRARLATAPRSSSTAANSATSPWAERCSSVERAPRPLPLTLIFTSWDDQFRGAHPKLERPAHGVAVAGSLAGDPGSGAVFLFLSGPGNQCGVVGLDQQHCFSAVHHYGVEIRCGPSHGRDLCCSQADGVNGVRSSKNRPRNRAADTKGFEAGNVSVSVERDLSHHALGFRTGDLHPREVSSKGLL